MDSNLMKKFHSFPILCLLKKETSSLNISNSKIYMISEQALENIFMHLSYHEIVKIRSVCHWFNFVTGSMLNKKFLSLPHLIEKKIAEMINASKSDAKFYGYLKVLCIVKSEIKILQASCEDYVLNNTFYFNGGAIIDTIELIVKLPDIKEASQLVTKLLMHVDKFLDNFDKVVEPYLIEKSVSLPQSWFGKKMVDIFECSLNCDKRIELKPNVGSQKGHCHIKGTYESRNVHSIKPPPQFSTNSQMTSTEMFMLMKYLRNHVRWNNTLNCQLQDDIENISEDKCLQELDNLIFQRKLDCNNIPFGPRRLVIDFDLFCLKVFAPKKYQSHLWNIGNSFDSKESVIFNEKDYILYLKLEIGYIENGKDQKVAKLKYIKLKQKHGKNIVTCYTKKMILNG